VLSIAKISKFVAKTSKIHALWLVKLWKEAILSTQGASIPTLRPVTQKMRPFIHGL
jgi:hypothetical protein